MFANPDLFRPQSLTSTPADEEGSVAVAAARGSLRETEKRNIEDLSFDSLPGTQQECDRLKEAFAGWHWRTQTFTGPETSKAALRQVHSPYVLHLATHRFFEPATLSGPPSLQLAALSVGLRAGASPSPSPAVRPAHMAKWAKNGGCPTRSHSTFTNSKTSGHSAAYQENINSRQMHRTCARR